MTGKKWYMVKGVDTRKFSPKVNKYNPEAELDKLTKIKRNKRGRKRQTPRIA
jgi:hypothetical protein